MPGWHYWKRNWRPWSDLAAANELPDAAITRHGRLKITPLDNAVPPEATALMSRLMACCRT
jgi:hypothetical protein